jgi:hypothetical protein
MWNDFANVFKSGADNIFKTIGRSDNSVPEKKDVFSPHNLFTRNCAYKT